MKTNRALRKPQKLGDLPTISIDRLERDLIALGQIGKNQDDGGVYRMAFTKADIEARKWLLKKIEEIGLIPSTDGAGNVFGLDDRAGSRSSYLIGSHLDSVPCAGVMDGALGVLGALECMRVIRENNIELVENLELVATSDEEGRFGGMLGAQAICGEISLKHINHAYDINGVSLVESMKSCSFDPIHILHSRRNREYMSGFLELHIEQGPVLENSNMEIGIVENISGVFKWKVKLIGESNHSGTTPMNMRRDAFQGLVEFSGEISRIIEENGTEEARATIGKVELFPGNPHTIPGVIEFSLVGRDFIESKMIELEEAFRKALSAISRRRGLMFEFEPISRISPVSCSSDVCSVIEEQAQKMNVKYMKIQSGAGHDAQIFGKYIPSSLIFIPSLNGISHSPDEWSSLEHIEIGTNLLLQTILKLLKKEKL